MRKTFSVGPFLVPVFIIGFGLVFAYANRDVPAEDMRLVTPLTIGLIIASVALALRIFLKGPGKRAPLTLSTLRRPGLLLLSASILIVGAQWDFPIAGIVFLFVAMILLGVRRWVVICPVAILAPLLLYIAFTEIGVPLNSLWLTS